MPSATIRQKSLSAGRYIPPRYTFNRFCHRVAALLRPERRLALGITIPQTVIVPDTSIYDGTIDASKMAFAGARGIIPKASQGDFPDPEFQPTWTNARGVLPRGSFHFYDPLYRPSIQVSKYVSLLSSDPGELALAVDWEATWSGPYAGWQNLYVFLEGLKQAAPGRRIMIYTGYFFWLDHSPNPITQPLSLAYFGQYDLWEAWYADPSLVRIPKPWTSLTFWQKTDSGNGPLYGTSSGAVDLSVYNGTFNQYVADFHLVGVTPPPPPVPPGGTMPTKVTVNAGSIANLKDAVTGTVLHVAQPGESVYGSLSTTGSDVTGFVHYYDAAGVQHPLTVSNPTSGAKVSIGTNVTVTPNATEPVTPPPPPSPPTSTTVTIALNEADGSVKRPKSIDANGNVVLG